MSGYETDALAWSEHQAALLRRLAAGERVNDLDWPNIIEEIESVGLSELHSVESLLIQALAHRLKSEAWPSSDEVPHWDAEARGFRDEAADRFAPSMRQRLDMAKIFRRALRKLPQTIDGQPPLPVSTSCPVTLDELLSDT